jgi:general secretion pathway protein F
MQYEVRALRQNEIVSLIFEAASEADARAQARAQSLKPLSVAARAGGVALRARGGGARFSLLLFSQELLALIEAGLSIVEAIDTLHDKEDRPEVKAVYGRIRLSLGEGKRFSESLEAIGPVFPPLYVGIVRAAEHTSNLPEALSRFIDYQVRIDAVRGKIVSAAVYPVILCVVGTLVITFLVGYVVPRFAAVYQGSGRPLPAVSAFLLACGTLVTAHQDLALGLLVALAAAALLGARALAARGGLATLLDYLPGIAPRVRLYSLARLYLTLGMLVDGGLPVVAALGMVEAMLTPALRGRLRQASAQIQTGESFTAAFERNGLTTPVSVRFLRVGERSSKLGEMLTRSARYYDGEIARWIDWFTKAFEPLLMAAIGLVVGVIVILLYMPIFDLAGSFQ